MIKVYIDNLGRILIPAFIRHELQIGANDMLELSVKDGKIVLETDKRYLCNNCSKNLLNISDNY